MKYPQPNGFVTDKRISIEEAMTAQRPVPPWRRKFKAIKTAVKKSAKPRRSWLIPLSVILLLIEWLLSTVVQLADVCRKSFETLTLTLENYIHEPTGRETSD